MTNTGPFTSFPGFDAGHMYLTYGDDVSIVKDILQEYLRELPHELQLMQQNLAHQRIDALMGNLHKLKPGFLYVGLPDLYHKVAEFETTFQAGRPEIVLKKYFPQLLNEMSQSHTLISQVLKSLDQA